MRQLILTLIGCLVFGFATSQDDLSPVADPTPYTEPIDYRLYQVATYAQSRNQSGVDQIINRADLRTTPDGRIQAVITHRGADGISLQALESLPLDIRAHRRNRASVFVDPDDVFSVARNLPSGYSMRSVAIEPSNTEGADSMNVNGYVSGGADGSGIDMSIIDWSWDQLTQTANAGAVGSYTLVNHTSDPFESGTNEHGTACYEAAYDCAPGADYFLHKISDEVDYGLAIDYAIDNGIEIISTSIGPHNTGWDDDSGPYCEASNDAADAGILVFVTVGNEAQQHWQGTFSDNDGDNWHAFQGTDESNNVDVGPNRTVRVWLQWDSDPPGDPYDLYLYDETVSNVLDLSVSTDEFESVSQSNNTGVTQTYKIAVKAKIPNPPEFEIFFARGAPEYTVAASSIESPGNSTAPNVISVGAVSFASYGDDPGTTPIEPYSSHGPTNSGNQAPDICSTDSITTFSTGQFTGTSCAAPSAAGAAAAFWSSNTDLSADGVRQILFKKADLYKDWGDPGTDMIYGNGGLMLYNYVNNTQYVLRSSGNEAGVSSLPYKYLSHADLNATNNGLTVILGGNYPGPVLLKNGNQRYVSLLQNSYAGN